MPSNDYYDHTTYPGPNAPGSSAALRAEFDLVEAGFMKLPTLTGNANLVTVVNSTATGLTATSALAGLTLNSSSIGATTPSTGAFTSLSATSLTVGGVAAVTLSGTQTLTNKTISGASNTFSAIGNSALTNSSLTIGSTAVSLGGTAATVAGLTLTAPTWTGAATGGSLSLSTALPLTSGGTGSDNAAGARSAILPSYTGNAGKAFRVNAGETDVEWFVVSGTGTVTSVAATVPSFLSIAGSPITGSGTLAISYSGTALPVANGGTGVTSGTGTGNNVLSTSPTLVTPILGTPASVTLTNATGLPLTTGVTGTLPVASGGTGLTSIAALSVPVANVANTYTTVTPTAGQSVRVNAGGTAWEAYTPAAGSTGTVSSVAATVPAFLSISGSPVTTSGTLAISYSGTALPVANGGTGVTTSTGTGNVVLSTSPTLVTPILGTPTSGTLTNATGLPLSTGVTGTLPVANGGTGVTSSTGSGNNVLSTSPTLVTPVLGTPTSVTLTNATGLPLTSGVTGTLPVANGGTGLSAYTANGVLYASGAGTLANGSALVFDPSSSLGITSTSPRVVDINSTSINGSGIRFNNSGTVNGYIGSAKYTVSGGALSDFSIDASGANSLVFGTNDTERMRLDSSGNLGIGVTPSAWGSAFKAIDAGSKSSFAAGGAGQPLVTDNTYYNGSNWIYKQTLPASYYQQNAGSHTWYIAPSGTAGNTISFTQAMTLDISGNLNVANLTASKPVFTDASKNLTSTGTVPVANGGTGLTGIAALSLPVANALNTYTTVTAAANQSVRVNSGGTAWEAYTPTTGTGTVTSVAATVPAFLSISGSPITTSGTLAITYSGTALPVLNGGTGQTTVQAAINSLVGATTSGQYLRGNGTNVVMAAIQSADVPTLNQNTTGTAAGLSTALVATSGGTGQTSYAIGDLLFASTTTALSKLADVATGNAIISGGVGVAPSYGKIGLTTHVSGTLPVANGGTGLTGIAALSAPVANSLNTYTTVTATASQSIRVNAGGTAWEAYTPTTGTVTTASVVSANGFAGTVATAGTTPAITLTTSITGVLKGNATAISAAVAGTDYVTPTGTETLSNKTLSGALVSTAATVSAGTNAQGQGALTSDYNIVTTAASNPSGVTLPTAAVGRTVIVVNKGANPINVYPATGGTIDALSANAAISVPVNCRIEFVASSTTQWYSTVLTSSVGTLPVANGGTGATTLTANNVILGNGTSAVQFVAPGTTGNVLSSNGTSWTSSAPTSPAPVIVVLTSGTSWTIPTDVKSVKATIVGAGGGGGRASSGLGSGGGSGGVVQAIFTGLSPGASISYSIGSGGAAAASQPATGTAGGSTTFNSVTAGGGSGGTSTGSNAASGGTATGGSINLAGKSGISWAATGLSQSEGGGTPLGLGFGGINSPAVSGVGYGFGGCGGSAGGAQDGGSGVVILEY